MEDPFYLTKHHVHSCRPQENEMARGSLLRQLRCFGNTICHHQGYRVCCNILSVIPVVTSASRSISSSDYAYIFCKCVAAVDHPANGLDWNGFNRLGFNWVHFGCVGTIGLGWVWFNKKNRLDGLVFGFFFYGFEQVELMVWCWFLIYHCMHTYWLEMFLAFDVGLTCRFC